MEEVLLLVVLEEVVVLVEMLPMQVELAEHSLEEVVVAVVLIQVQAEMVQTDLLLFIGKNSIQLFMKKIIVFLTLVLMGFTITAQQKTNPQVGQNTQPVKLSTKADSLQYAEGAATGQWMLKNNFEVKNAKLFLNGMDDVLQKKALVINDSIIRKTISEYQLTTQIEKSRLLEEQLFATLKGKTGVGVLPNGVHYLIRRQGEGVRPSAKSTVLINAIGVLPDGTIFEDTYKKKQAITATINTLIPGLNEAVQLMPVGSVWRVFIPSALGYGAQGLQGLVPPYSALVYDIELIEIKVN
jgi:FKBP-type peptidyl-prolyl cis-trans isomerase